MSTLAPSPEQRIAARARGLTAGELLQRGGVDSMLSASELTSWLLREQLAVWDGRGRLVATRRGREIAWALLGD